MLLRRLQTTSTMICTDTILNTEISLCTYHAYIIVIRLVLLGVDWTASLQNVTLPPLQRIMHAVVYRM